MPIKSILMLKRKKGMTPEEFRIAYETRHSRLALRLFGHLWIEYRRNYLGTASSFLAEAGTPTSRVVSETQSTHDVITEIVYRDMDALEESNRIAAIPENRRLLAEDEEELFDREACYAAVVEVFDEDLSGVDRS